MSAERDKIVEWVASQVLPHEREVRARLKRLGSDPQEIDDIVQDAYLHISRLAGTDHIRDGRAYLLETARMVLLQRVRRERIVRIAHLTDGQALALVDEAPDPERQALARQELERALQLMEKLPPRCRQIFELRRIEGISHRIIAEKLGMSKGAVVQEALRGLRLLLDAMNDIEGGDLGRKRRTGLFRGRFRTGRSA